MNRLHSVIYPVTYTGFNIIRRLSGIFQRLTILVPAEDCASSDQAFTHEGIVLSPVAPCPFGERLPWFNGFIGSITGWARDIGLGKGLDSQPAGDSLKDDESIPAIIDALGKEGRQDPLLEAQIFLRLAHDLDQREDETELALAALKTKEASLKDILHGVISAPDELGRPIPEPNETTWTVSMPFKRLAAWSQLWTMAGADIQGTAPVGIGIGIKDLMDNAYESLVDEPAVDILSLKLHGNPDVQAGMKDGIEDLVKAVSILQKAGPEASQKETAKTIDKLKQEGSRISDAFTHDMGSGPTLALSLYPRVSFGDLLLKASKRRPIPCKSGLAGYSFYLY